MIKIITETHRVYNDKDYYRNTPCVHDKEYYRNTPCVLNWIFTFLLKKKIIQSNLVKIYYKMYNPLLQMTSLFYMVILLVYCVIMKLLKFNATIKTPDINHVIRNGSAVASPITWFITKKIKVLFFFVRIEDKLVSKIVQSVHFFQKIFENGTFRYLK